MELETIETHRMPDGTEYRVSLARDPEPQEPYDDGGWPILRVRSSRYGGYSAVEFNKQAEPYVSKFNELLDRMPSLRVWERFAKIFLGAKHVHEWGFNRVSDYGYIAFDTPEWREAVGAPDDLSEEDPLTEVKAWLEGEVYGRVVHKRYNPDESMEDDEGWTDFEDGYWVWGFYGRKWAEEDAKSLLAECVVASHKEVHRYPEHEKIAPHQKEIDAILVFLEGLDSEDMCLARIFDSGPHLQRVPESRHQRVVFEHFGISYNKIEQERELMFKRLRDNAKEATD